MLNLGSVLTIVISIVGSMGSGVIFLMKYEGRTTAIERDAQDRERRVNQLEQNFRALYPIIQQDKANVRWLMQKEKDRFNDEPDDPDP